MKTAGGKPDREGDHSMLSAWSVFFFVFLLLVLEFLRPEAEEESRHVCDGENGANGHLLEFLVHLGFKRLVLWDHELARPQNHAGISVQPKL